MGLCHDEKVLQVCFISSKFVHFLLKKKFSEENQVVLTKHLLKTIGTDLTNSFFELVANQNLMSLNENENFTAEVRFVLFFTYF